LFPSVYEHDGLATPDGGVRHGFYAHNAADIVRQFNGMKIIFLEISTFGAPI